MIPALLAVLQGLVVSTGTLLVLFVGFCLICNIPKLRSSGRHSRVVRGLDELIGMPQIYLQPRAPRGPVDQLHTPELLETHGRNSG